MQAFTRSRRMCSGVCHISRRAYRYGAVRFAAVRTDITAAFWAAFWDHRRFGAHISSVVNIGSALAGMSAWATSYPLDVIKTNIQGQPLLHRGSQPGNILAVIG